MTMSGAKTLLLDLVAVILDGEKAAPFFADDGVLELPFLHAVGSRADTSSVSSPPKTSRLRRSFP